MNIAMLLDIPASIAPDQPILVGEGETKTYTDVIDEASQWRSQFREFGIQSHSRVLVLSTNRSTLIPALFAAASLGAVSIPVNFRSRESDLAHFVSDAQPSVILTEDRYLDMVQEINVAVPVLSLDTRPSDQPPEWEVRPSEPGDLALILYTSGTTSAPKGVPITHEALSSYVTERMEVADDTHKRRVLLAAPLFHVAGVTALLNAIYGGLTVVLEGQFDPQEWLELVETEQITHVFCVPTMLAEIVQHPSFPSTDLRSLEVVTYGAAPMPHALLLRCLEVFPKSTGFVGAYGLTETTSTVAILDIADHTIEGPPQMKAEKLQRLRSVGRPVPDVEIRVVREDGSECDVGEVGTIQIRTRRTVSSYWNPEDERPSDGAEIDWMATGDVGYFDDGGYLFLMSRADDLIIRGGENISPSEIEDALLTHPDIADACVVGIEDMKWGQRVAAAVVSRSGVELDVGQIEDHLKPLLPGFKRPETIMTVSDLPRTFTGKLKRADVRSQLSNR